jgi:hypothetical protein
MAASLLAGLKDIMGDRMAAAGIRLEGDEPEEMDRELGNASLNNTGYGRERSMISLQYVTNLSGTLIAILLPGWLRLPRGLLFFSPQLVVHLLPNQQNQQLL